MSLPDWKAIPVRTKRSRKRLHNLIADEFSLDSWIELPNPIKRSKRKLYNYYAEALHLEEFNELLKNEVRSTKEYYNYLKENANKSSAPTLTIIVTDGEDPLKDATVTIGETIETTDAAGTAEFTLDYDDYIAEIQLAGYITQEAELKFRSNKKTFTITLEENNSLVLSWDSSVQTTAALTNSIGFNLSDGAIGSIDWGDGTTTTYTRGSDFYHTYEDDDEYTINFYVEDGSITALNAAIFYYKTGLTSMKIPNTVTSIKSSCFEGCSNLTRIKMPNSITSISNNCFAACTGLTRIKIPNTVTSISGTSFNGCTNLTDVQLYWTDTDIIPYTDAKFDVIDAATLNSTVYTIPNNTRAKYIEKGYPTSRLQERT